MGSRRVAGDGKSADASSRRFVGSAAGRLRDRVPARCSLLLLRVSALWMASDVLHWRTAGAACALCTLSSSGVGSLAAHPPQRLEQPRSWHRIALEAFSLHHAAHGRNELRFARNAGHVSDISPAGLGVLAAEARGAHCILNGRSDNRGSQLRLPVR